MQSNTLVEEAVVVSVGERFFNVNVPRLGVTDGIFLDKIPDIVATFNQAKRTLNLQATSTVTHQWTTATIRILVKLVVRVVATNGVPIESKLEFLRPV